MPAVESRPAQCNGYHIHMAWGTDAEEAAGYRTRPGTDADAAVLAGLAGSVLDTAGEAPVHGPWTRHLLRASPSEDAVIPPGLEVTVVEGPGGEIVGCAFVLPQRLRVGGVELGMGHLEQVAIRAEHRGHGLSRQLIAAAHEGSRRGGHVLQCVRGIRWFYRRHGYWPAIDLPRRQPVDVLALSRWPIPQGHRLRAATTADASLLATWDAQPSPNVDSVTRPRSADEWCQEIDRPRGHPWRTSLHLVLDDAGLPVGCAGILHLPGAPRAIHRVQAAPGADPRAVLRTALDLLSGPADVLLLADTHPLLLVAPELVRPAGRAGTWGIRCENLPGLLATLRPALSTRVRRSAMSGWRGGVLVDTGEVHVRLSVVAGDEVDIALVDGEATTEPDALVPPASLLALVLGHRPLDLLEAADGDLRIDAPHARVALRAMFPPVSADLWPTP